jgi:superfamily I DNA/RNA helicase
MRDHGLAMIPNPSSRHEHEPYYKADDILALFDRLKASCPEAALTFPGLPDFEYDDDHLARLHRLYTEAMKARHALDFSDLIYLVRAIFKGYPELREKWAGRFRFIQVDEIQDTHLAEYAVIKILASARNIAFFGDLDQSIYGWRGSAPFRVRDAYVMDFKPVHCGLPVNYRATKTLVRAADSFAQGAFARRSTRLVAASSCPAGDKVGIHQAEDEEAEGVWIATTFRREIQSGRRPGRMAVLCRSNRKAERVGAALSLAGVPCLTAEQVNFFQRQEVKVALAVLRLLLNPCDSPVVHRLAVDRVSGVGEAFLKRIMLEGAMAGLLVRFREEARVVRPPELLRKLVLEMGMREAYKADVPGLAGLDRLVGIFGEHDDLHLAPWESLKGIIHYTSLAKNLDQLSARDDKVIVVPIHQSKGLEFDVVCIAGAVEGVMPHYYSGDLEEEKRLFYVAMTRPKEKLYITGFRILITSDGRVIKKKMTPYTRQIAPGYIDKKIVDVRPDGWLARIRRWFRRGRLLR